MQFTIKRTVLRSALVLLRKAAGKKRGPAALRHVLVQVECLRGGTGRVRFNATNLDTVLTFNADVPEASPGTVCVPINELATLLRGSGSPEVTLVQSGRLKVQLSSGDQSGILACLPPSDFPPLPPSPRLAPTSSSLINQLHRASSFQSTDESRLVLNGVHLDTSRRSPCVVASDGHRLLTLPTGKLPPTLREPVTIPVRRIPWRVFQEDPSKILAGTDGKRFAFQSGHWQGGVKLVDGKFPDWRQVLPKNAGSSRIVINDDNLAETAKWFGNLNIAKESTDPLALVSRRQKLFVRFHDPKRKLLELEVPHARPHGSPSLVVLNRSFLADALKAGFGILNVTDEQSPLDLRNGVKGERAVLMPLRHTALAGASENVVRHARTKSTPKPKPRTRTQSSPMMPKRAQPKKGPSNGSADTLQQLQDACGAAKAVLRDGAAAVNEISMLAKQLSRQQKLKVSEMTAMRKALSKLKTLSI